MKDDNGREMGLQDWQTLNERRFAVKRSDGSEIICKIRRARQEKGRHAITLESQEGSPLPVCMGSSQAITTLYVALLNFMERDEQVKSRIFEVLEEAAKRWPNWTDTDGNIRDLAASLYQVTTPQAAE